MIHTKTSAGTVDETVARLQQVIAENGLKLFAVFDHGGEAAANGLVLRETKVVVFGNPAAGTPIMEAYPLVALDLPLRVLVWDEDGQTQISYTPPAELATRYGLEATLAAPLAAIDRITDAALA